MIDQDQPPPILSPPYHLYNPPKDQWVLLPVLRWEAGLMQVPKRLEAGSVIKVGLRFHLTGDGFLGLAPYLDMTHRLLLQRFFRAWTELARTLSDGDLRERVLLGARLDPATAIPLKVRILRRGVHPDSTYEIEVLRDWEGGA